MRRCLVTTPERPDDELRSMSGRAASGITSSATETGLGDALDRAKVLAVRNRRLVTSVGAGMLVVAVVAATLVATRPSGDDESNVLARGRVADTTTSTSTSTTATTTTTIVALPTSSVPPLDVTVPRPVVVPPRKALPRRTPTIAVNGAGGCGRADAYGENPVHYAAVSPSGRIIAVLSQGDVALSDDLGSTWTFHCHAMRTEASQSPYVARMAAVANGVVWAQLMDSPASLPFVRSLDGGQTWTSIGAPASGVDVNNASFVSATTVWAWGTREDKSRVLFRTVDGTTWAEVATPNREPVADAVFLDGNVGWMATRGSPNDTVHATTDGGATWQKSDTPPLDQVLGIDAYDAEHVHLAARLQDGRRAAVSTSDGGKTWNVTEITTGLPVVVAAINDRAAVLLAQSAPIWHTLDGGATWTRVSNLEIGPYSPRFAHAAGGRYAVVPSGSMIGVTDNESRTWRRAVIRAR